MFKVLTGEHQPPSGHGKLLWHALGAETVQLVHENVHLETVRDDLETLVIDAEVLRRSPRRPGPGKKVQRASGERVVVDGDSPWGSGVAWAAGYWGVRVGCATVSWALPVHTRTRLSSSIASFLA